MAPFVRNASDKAQGQQFAFAKALGCAWRGVIHGLKTQRNFKIHAVIALVAIGAAFLLALSPLEFAIIFLCIFMVFCIECLNTAIEAVVDLITTAYDPLARIAKDCAAGAVLISALGAVVVGLLIYIPAFCARFGF